MDSRLDTRLRLLGEALARKSGVREALQKELRQTEQGLKDEEQRRQDILEAQAVIQETAVETQQELQFHVSSVASLALSTVFQDPYTLLVTFTPKRGKSEAVLSFQRDGREIDPMTASGGGVVDLAAFALRVSMLSLQKPLRRVLLLDEPFRFLSKDLQPRAGEVLRELSRTLGIQFVIVTHEQALVEAADRLFRVTQAGGVSSLEAQDLGE